MATTQAKANPKKSSGFQGVKNAFFIILVCFVLAVLFFKYILGAPEHFVNGDPTQPVKDGNLMGTVYKGGVVVPVIITLLFSVIALSIERFFALRTAFGKSSLGKFVVSVKKAITAGDMAKAQELCDKQQGSVLTLLALLSQLTRRWRQLQTSSVLLRFLRSSRLTRRLHSSRCLHFR